MNQTLSVYFSSDRTYFSFVESTINGLKLLHINSTKQPINLENPDDSQEALNELNEILSGLTDNHYRISVILPTEYVLVSQFPSKPNITDQEIKKLINLEIRQTYPQFNYEDFTATIINMLPRQDGKSMIMAVIVSKQMYKSSRKILQHLKKPITNIEISQLCSHTAFFYNYPEHSDKITALLNIQKKFIDVSVVKNKNPLYYNLLSYADIALIPEILRNLFSKLLKEYTNSINNAFLFGPELTKSMLDDCVHALVGSGLVETAGRLNAFRMLETVLSKRERDYCLRTAHIFPPCIGGCLPAYHEKFKIY